MVFYVQRVLQKQFVRVLFKVGPGILHCGMPRLRQAVIDRQREVQFILLHMQQSRHDSVRTGNVFCGSLVICKISFWDKHALVPSMLCNIYHHTTYLGLRVLKHEGRPNNGRDRVIMHERIKASALSAVETVIGIARVL